ncbi:MAG: coproporphyrinogen-III oxidase family protein, partial [Thermoanaerobaculia bacterium]|nr:coproporphyrinogen-III oxidase family protein [Thermoanaerobaculia bacterium]
MPTPESAPSGAVEEPAGVYVHIPFCSAICPYCDFAVTVGDAAARRRLVEALAAEAGRTGAEFGRPVDTVYWGGGTPSLLALSELEPIALALDHHLELVPGTRHFLEANPEDVDTDRLETWRDLGVGTLSLGVQALDAAALEFLGRRHSAEQGRRAVELALAAGFGTVSIDLIYGRPGQSVDEWRRELDAAVDLGVDHLSCYQLTLEPGTPFGRRAARGELAAPPPDLEADLFFATHEHLAEPRFEA